MQCTDSSRGDTVVAIKWTWWLSRCGMKLNYIALYVKINRELEAKKEGILQRDLRTWHWYWKLNLFFDSVFIAFWKRTLHIYMELFSKLCIYVYVCVCIYIYKITNRYMINEITFHVVRLPSILLSDSTVISSSVFWNYQRTILLPLVCFNRKENLSSLDK